MQAGIIAPGWGLVNLSQFRHRPPKLGRGGSLTTME